MTKPRILIVEDESIVAMDIALQLRDLGYQPVGHATSGEQAIELAQRLRPDLTLMDIQLATDMDGITTAMTMRTKFDLRCVFLSAFDGSDCLERAKLAEPAGYVAKPFTEYDLRAAVESALKV
jgi:CheY-like chemotaxis protein